MTAFGNVMKATSSDEGRSHSPEAQAPCHAAAAKQFRISGEKNRARVRAQPYVHARFGAGITKPRSRSSQAVVAIGYLVNLEATADAMCACAVEARAGEPRRRRTAQDGEVQPRASPSVRPAGGVLAEFPTALRRAHARRSLRFRPAA